MTPTRRTVLIGTVGVGCGVARSTQAKTPTRPALQMRSWMALASVPGASWTVFDNAGQTDTAEGYAKAGEVEATTETLFEAASLSKPILAVAIHDLVRNGAIYLDEPVTKHIDFTEDAVTRTITPRHLLSHSSGLPNWRTETGRGLVSRFRPHRVVRVVS